MADLEIDVVWTTNYLGEVVLEFVPAGIGGPAIGSYTLDFDTIVQNCREEMSHVQEDIHMSDEASEWGDIERTFDAMAQGIRQAINEAANASS